MAGLLNRGSEYLQNHADGSGDSPSDFDLSGTEGISSEDQQDIIKQIETVAAENRIKASPDVFAYRALKKGSLFPLIINISAIVALAAGLGLMAYFFRQTESRITGQNTKITTAEGEILQEVRREAQQQLQQKNQQISSIQTKLQQISNERSQLQANMDTRIQERESELKKQMDAALAEERQKLQSQGVSEAEIKRRLAELEATKTREFNAQMGQFRKDAEAQRQKLADSLKQLEAEYQTNLQQATRDRAQIQQAADQKIAQLQSQLQGELTQSKAALTAAQRQLAALQSTNAQEQTASAQIAGFYTQVRNAVDETRYPDALKSLSNLRDYLSTEAVLAIPAIRQRRPAELYIINSLSTLINQQAQQSAQDTSSLLAAASIVDQAKALAAQAAQLSGQGQTKQAEDLYKKAIALVPGIEASHQYLVAQAQKDLTDSQNQLAALEQQQATLVANDKTLRAQLQEETAKNQALVRRQQNSVATNEATDARFQNAMNQARSLYAAGRYTDSLASYQRALTLIPAVGDSGGGMITQISDSGYRIQSDATTRAATTQAAPVLAQAKSLFDQKKFGEAINAYGQLIRDYPLATQVPDAIAGMKSAFTARVSALESQIADLTKERDNLKTQVSASQAASGGSATGGAAADPRVASLTTENQKLTDQMKKLQDQISSLEQDKTSLQNSLARAQAAGPVMDAATQQELAQLRTIGKTYDALKSDYQSYTTQENGVLGAIPSGANPPLPSQAALLKGKVLLDTFLSSDQMRTVFPGLLDRIRMYDRGFEAAGRTAVLSNLSDMVYQLSQYATVDERTTYIKQQISQTSSAEMKSFLQDLEQLVTAQ